MELNIGEIANKWKNDEPKYKKLGECVYNFLKDKITDIEILPEISHRTKDLISIIKKIKKKQREKEYGYHDLNDKLGIRIICNFTEDTEKVDTFLYDIFDIKKFEKKRDELIFNRLDYISNHYDASIKSESYIFKSVKDLSDLIFEVQVRTLNQHAWANCAHSLSYKQEIDLSAKLQRRVYRLLSIYEIADDEFSAVNKILLDNPDNLTYTILRKLEGKIYKYAQADYDRDTSIYNLKILLNYFSKEQQNDFIKNIESFITTNSDKIKNIFFTNKLRYFEFPFLTQPEIFLIWYILEQYPFILEENWDNDFDHSELEQIKIFWGKTID